VLYVLAQADSEHGTRVQETSTPQNRGQEMGPCKGRLTGRCHVPAAFGTSVHHKGHTATQGTGWQAEPGFALAPATRTQDPEQPLRHTGTNRTGRQTVALEATGELWE